MCVVLVFVCLVALFYFVYLHILRRGDRGNNNKTSRSAGGSRIVKPALVDLETVGRCANRNAGCRPSRSDANAGLGGGRLVCQHCVSTIGATCLCVCLLSVCGHRAEQKQDPHARVPSTNIWEVNGGQKLFWGGGAPHACALLLACTQRRQSNARIILYNIRPCELSSVAAPVPSNGNVPLSPPERGGEGPLPSKMRVPSSPSLSSPSKSWPHTADTNSQWAILGESSGQVLQRLPV